MNNDWGVAWLLTPLYLWLGYESFTRIAAWWKDRQLIDARYERALAELARTQAPRSLP